MIKTAILLIVILFIGGLFRFFGLNWDQNQHLNPDERFLTMVAQNLQVPQSIHQYLNTNKSLFNPNNIGYDFYVYGTYPIHLIKGLAILTQHDNYTDITLLGRLVSALLDTGSILLIFLIARRLRFSDKAALIASLSYACMALPIQLSHFFTVDPYVVFFSLFTIYFTLCIESTSIAALLAGMGFGLAVSAKISGALVAAPVLLIWIGYLLQKKQFTRIVISAIIFTISSVVTLRLAFPYIFEATGLIPTNINPKFITAIKQLESFNTTDGWFPPSVQWINMSKGVFPLENILFWGIGLPLSICLCLSLIKSLISIKKIPRLLVPLSVIIVIYIYQSLQFAQPMRYFYPLYPAMALIIGFALSSIRQKIPLVLICLSFIAWPLAVSAIYTRPHTRIVASHWINQHIPPNSKISCELWDDCLPLGGPGQYQMVELPLYNSEIGDKWTDINTRINSLDYIILSSNRLYGSIMANPQLYPQTTNWYKDLFTGKLGFKKIAEFTSRPTLPIPGLQLCLTPPNINYGAIAKTDQKCDTSGLSFVDDYADESWTVYDHPKVIIFQRVFAQ